MLLAVWLDHHRRATELDGLRAEAAGSEPLTITGRDPDGLLWFYENEGKRSGAYSANVYGDPRFFGGEISYRWGSGI